MENEPQPRGWAFPMWIGLELSRDDRFHAPENRNLLLGYLLGFTEAIADDGLRSRATDALLKTIFGDNPDVRYLAIGLASAGNAEVVKGAGFGLPDGQRFFKICDEWMSCSADEADRVFLSLRSMPDFLK